MLIRDFLPHIEAYFTERYGAPTKRYTDGRGRPFIEFGPYLRIRLSDGMIFHLGVYSGSFLGWSATVEEAKDQREAARNLSAWMHFRTNPNRERPQLRALPRPAPKAKESRPEHDCGWSQYWSFEFGDTEQRLASICAITHPYTDEGGEVVAVTMRLGCLLCGAKVFAKGHIDRGRVVWQRIGHAPPYRLTDWFYADQETPELLVVEGEKCADAVAIHQRAYVTSLESIRPETLWYLRGFRVRIQPDRDGLGMNAAALKRALDGVAASVEIIEPDNLFNDTADRILFAMGPQEFCYWVAASPIDGGR